ncbi:hypothetical protein EMWEY_00011850 [Eimeria maxima]|uniref:Uncharacterized protein n=1 Tax=Eimeria maxima TaxID=5804 RepID=U6MF91_EIMMA|nr:hypothetical protein EMWEY_00011850 [Eimeria maxima]CDJ61718.1 hypothetical protein EMWEY_00011850 [Eimeria maxima]
MVIIVSVCNAWHSRKHFPGVTPRSLSEDGHDADEDVLSIVEGCLELEAELGILHQRAIVQPDTDPVSRVEGLVSVLHAAAAEHESGQWISSAWDATPVSHVLSARTQQHTDESLLRLHSTFPPDDTQKAIAHTAPPIASPTRHAHLDAAQALDPEAWLDSIPEIISKAQEQEVVHLALPTAGETDSRESSTSVVAMQTLRDSVHVPDEEIRNHPYVRLPVLAEDVVVRRINVTELFTPFRSRLPPHIFLLRLRRLFAQRVLRQKDVNMLVAATEGLIGAAWYQAKKTSRLNRPVYAAETFGKYFLALDAIACTIELLGDNMQLPLWWGKFIAPFNHHPLTLPPLGNRIGGFYRRLISRILNALDVYKTGRRPELKEIISLKKKLFCFRDAPGGFKDGIWDPWRDDAYAFSKSGDASC